MTERIINKIISDKKYEYLILFVILSTLTVLMIAFYMPLQKLNPGHDALFHYRRIKVLSEALCNGYFPVYIDHSALNNYGYGFRWFYPNLTLIPFSYLNNYLSIHTVYKIMWFSMTVICGFATYIVTKKITKSKFAAIVTCLLYTFCEYRLQDMYYRSSVGESFTFTFLPIIFWGLYEIIKGDYRKWYILSIGMSLTIYSHLLSSFLISLTIILLAFVYYKDFTSNKKRIYYLILSGIITFLLCGYFLFPFIEQLYSSIFYFQNTNSDVLIEQARISNKQIIKSLFSTYLFYPGNVYEKNFNPSIGILLTVSILLRFFLRKKKNNKILKNVDILVIIGLIFILLSLEIIPWKINPIQLIDTIQFPWRFFELSVFFLAIGGGYYISLFIKKSNYQYLSLSILILLTSYVIVKTSSIYKYNTYYYKPQNSDIPFDIKNANSISWNLEYLPQKTSSLILIEKKGENISYQNEETSISGFKRTNNGLNFDINVNKPDIVELPLIYYKGYNGFINNEILEINESKNGFVEIPIKTSGKVNIAYTGTPIQKYSLYITILAYITLAVYILKNSKNKLRKNA